MYFNVHVKFYHLRTLILRWLYTVKFKFRKTKGTAVNTAINTSIERLSLDKASKISAVSVCS